MSAEKERSAAAKVLGAMGGKARAKALMPERLREIGRAAAKARYGDSGPHCPCGRFTLAYLARWERRCKCQR